MSRKSALVVLVACFAALPATAWAASEADCTAQWKSADGNNDGVLAGPEADRYLAYYRVRAHVTPVDGRITQGGIERRVIMDDRGAFEGVLAARGWRRTSGVTVQDAQSALAIVSQSDMAALVPRRVANAFAQHYGIKLFDPPYPVESQPVEAGHPRQQQAGQEETRGQKRRGARQNVGGPAAGQEATGRTDQSAAFRLLQQHHANQGEDQHQVDDNNDAQHRPTFRPLPRLI